MKTISDVLFSLLTGLVLIMNIALVTYRITAAHGKRSSLAVLTVECHGLLAGVLGRLQGHLRAELLTSIVDQNCGTIGLLCRVSFSKDIARQGGAAVGLSAALAGLRT